jgi:hypothetical protein
MSAKNILMCASEDKLYVDDVFSTTTYVGNSSLLFINNGIDYAGKGGMVWIKQRNNESNHTLCNTNYGGNFLLSSNNNSGNTNNSGVSGFYNNGFSVSGGLTNQNDGSFVSWTFRKAPKFFDIVIYNGDGTSNRQITHNLGITPGMVMTKSTSTTGDWNTYHRSATGDLILNTPAVQTGGHTIVTGATNSTFTVTGVANTNGVSYIAYIFAHDTSTDGIIQCGIYTTDASGKATVNLGWEPQYLMVKRNYTEDWIILDSMRGLSHSSNSILSPNLSNAESNGSGQTLPTSTGFNVSSGSSATYIYMAIRRPNKPPTTGAAVYNAIARTGTGALTTVTGVGFAPDLIIHRSTSSALMTARRPTWHDKLRGQDVFLYSESIETEKTDEGSLGQKMIVSFEMDGYKTGTDIYYRSMNNNTDLFINHFFKRAPGVFSILCYTGTGVSKTEPHDLGSNPELWLVKSRNSATGWSFGSSLLNNNEYITCPSPTGKLVDSTLWNQTYPSKTAFSFGNSSNTNGNSANYVCYMWASLIGVSKVFTYTGNGSSQDINCGFTTGARFVMIIRTTVGQSQDIFIFDSTRGIVSANDHHLSLNTSEVEVTTDDSIDPLNVGFTINQNASTNLNVTGNVYIGLAYS